MQIPLVINAAGRLDRLPVSRFHWKIFLLISAGAFMDAFDIYLASGVLASMVDTGFTNMRTGALFMSVGFVGMTIGAMAAGYVGDRFGRRFSYQINLGIFGIASIAASLAPTIEWVIALRFLMGLGLGAELVVAAGTLAEFVPPGNRGKWTGLLAIVTNSGLLAATAVGYWLIPHLGWRYMFGLAGLGAFIVWIMRHRMPESPRWLESTGRHQEAQAVLTDIEEQVRQQTGPLPEVNHSVDLHVGKVPFRRLFGPTVRRRTLVAAVTVICINFALYGFVSWLPTFFVQDGISVSKSLGFSMLMAFGAPIGGVLSLVVADRIGRKKSLVCAALASIALGWGYTYAHEAFSLVIIGFALLTMIYTITTLGLFSYVPELFPTETRLRGTGLAGMCGRGMSIFTPYLTLPLYHAYGVAGVIALLSAFLALLAIVVGLLGAETAGRSLEVASPTTSTPQN